MRLMQRLARQTHGSALVELAICTPLLVVFVVGIYDFSGAFNQKQKIEHAAQVGAAIAGSQPTSDLDVSNPDSLQAAVTVVFNTLDEENVLPLARQGSCMPGRAAVSKTDLVWTYQISGCSNVATDVLAIKIERGIFQDGTPATVSTAVTVTYPYRWRFNSVIQLLFPGSSSYSIPTNLHETATVHSQL